jgi:hypothetical protein
MSSDEIEAATAYHRKYEFNIETQEAPIYDDTHSLTLYLSCVRLYRFASLFVKIVLRLISFR